MTRSSREQGYALQEKTKVLYLPLLNLTPSDESTMLTGMLKAVDLSKEAGQEYVVLTLDQQLYRVALHVLWDDPNRFPNFFLRLGGMHLLMSFVSASSTLLNGSGENEVLGAVFAVVTKMLSDKKFPYNVRALRMHVEEVLRLILCSEKQDITCMDDLQAILDQLSKRSRTSKLWIDCLNRPVLIILKYVRAEREGDWHLHLRCVEAMIPYFFAGGHVHYARHALY